jgi:mono/diheme cytochrome c family protein
MNNGAMGNITGANITPFQLKDWSDEEIARAIRYGIHKSGRSLKFMPSFDYQGLSKGDIAALVAYLRSVPEVSTASAQNSFGPIAKMMGLLGKMPVVFPAENIDLKKGFAEKPEEAPTKEFGKYLAQACSGCHGQEFNGGPIPGGDPSWPPAANIRLGSNALWNEEVFTQMIKSGISPSTKNPIRAPMPVNLLKQMNELEIKALWIYFSGLN